MTTADFLYACTLIALGILVIAFVVISIRIIVGPTLPDRVLGLDMLVATGIGFIAVVAVKTTYFLYLDIAIALGLVGFLATVAFARFILKRDKPEEEAGPGPIDEPSLSKSSARSSVADNKTEAV
ncbi:MAG: cation:proton antiporter [Cohaesibacteraceae bacterium]